MLARQEDPTMVGFGEALLPPGVIPMPTAVRLSFADVVMLYAPGLPVFPLRPDKSPYIAHGFKAATADPAQIAAWSKQWPNALVGVPTGPASRLFVLDVDVKKGKDGFETLRRKGWIPPPTQTHTTRNGGGKHYLFRWPDGGNLSNSVDKLGAGLDTRGNGGYIVWWAAHGGAVEHAGIHADIPDWLLNALATQAPSTQTTRGQSIAEGGRNDTLFRSAASMRAKGMTGEQIETALLAENAAKCDPPLPPSEVATIAHSATRYESGDARDGTATTRPLTELGNARRLQDLHGDTVRYIPESKTWLVWRDGAWAVSPDGAPIRSLAAELPACIYGEGALYQQHMDSFGKWARASQTQQKINAAVSLLSDMPNMRAPLATIDANPWFVGLDQGKQLIDLQSGAIRITQPKDLITKALGVTTLGQATEALRWQAFLNQVFQGDSELIDWLQRWCGYLLTGSTREQVLLFGYGLGANGKSVFAEVLRFIMGDYAKPMQSETLTETKRTAGGASPDLAALVGARLALANETEDGARLAESLVKSLTGGDAVSVRPLYGTPFSFAPTFKLLILGNHKPVIRGADHGIWRRILLLPFTRTFAPADRDPELTAKLKAEAPHIVAWMLEGCLAWRVKGLSDIPATIARQTEEYRNDMDTLGQWFDECCNLAPEAETASGLLYQNYTVWCQANGVRANSNVAFGRRLSERGFTERRAKAARYRVGIALVSPMPFHPFQHHG